MIVALLAWCYLRPTIPIPKKKWSSIIELIDWPLETESVFLSEKVFRLCTPGCILYAQWFYCPLRIYQQFSSPRLPIQTERFFKVTFLKVQIYFLKQHFCLISDPTFLKMESSIIYAVFQLEVRIFPLGLILTMMEWLIHSLTILLWLMRIYNIRF